MSVCRGWGESEGQCVYLGAFGGGLGLLRAPGVRWGGDEDDWARLLAAFDVRQVRERQGVA